jgi:putative transposase
MAMKKTHTPEQIINILRQVERETNQGKTAAEGCRTLGVSEWSFYRWRRKYGGMEKSDAKQLKELEKENARLKKLLAEKELDNDILKEALKTKF